MRKLFLMAAVLVPFDADAQPLLGTGLDYSANQPAIPCSGCVQLAQIPVNLSRMGVEVQNQSAALLQVVIDNGAGANQSVVNLASGGSNGQGGDFTSVTRGRVTIYGPSGSQFMARQD